MRWYEGYQTLWVTRQDGNGVIHRLGVGKAYLFLALLVLQANVLGWGLYGLYALGDKLI